MCLTCCSVKADTTADVYHTLSVPSKTLAEEQEYKIKTLTNDYTIKLDEYTSIQDYNTIINNLDIAGIKQQYSDKVSALENIESEIRFNGYFADVQELNSLYTKYRDLQRDVHQLKAKLRKYENWKPKELPNYDLDTLSLGIEKEKQTLEIFNANAEVGDVSTLFNFIQAEYVVKHRFDGAGVLYRTQAGTGILSIFAGTCIYSDRDDVLGEVIKVDCGDGIIITYTGLRSRYVQKDDVVKQYQKIASTHENVYVILEVNGIAYDVDLLYGGKLEVGQTS